MMPRLALLALLALCSAAAASATSMHDAMMSMTPLHKLKCSQFINFQLDVSNSMSEADRQRVREGLVSAVAGLAPANGDLYYQFSTFDKAARNAHTDVRKYSATTAFAHDVAESLPAYAGYDDDGSTNHGAAIRLGYNNIKAARKQVPGLAAYTVMVVTDGETTWWTDHVTKYSKAAKKNWSRVKDNHDMCNHAECEINKYARLIKEDPKQRLAVLFAGDSELLRMAAEKRRSAREKENGDIRLEEEADMLVKRSIMLRSQMKKRSSIVAGDRLFDDLDSYQGFAGAVNRLVAGSCGVKIPPKKGPDYYPVEACDEDLYVTVVSDISRSTLEGENPTANVKGVWDALREMYSSTKVHVRVIAFASQWFEIVPEFVTPEKAAEIYADFELGLTAVSQAKAVDGQRNGYPISGAPESKFQNAYKTYMAKDRQWTARPGVEVSAKYQTPTSEGTKVTVKGMAVDADRHVAYFRAGGKFHWLLDDTLPEPALAEAARKPGVPENGRHVYLMHSDAGGYNNDYKPCHDSYVELYEHDKKIKLQHPEMSAAQRHKFSMKTTAGRRLERRAATCCSKVDRRCDLETALEKLTDPIVALFVGTTFRSDTTIRHVINANRAHGFEPDSLVYVGDTVSQYPEMARAAISQAKPLRRCYRTGVKRSTSREFHYVVETSAMSDVSDFGKHQTK